MNNIFDTHAHYSPPVRRRSRRAADALPAGGVVGVLECATHSGDAAQVLSWRHAAPYFHAALGIHPESLIDEDAATVAVYHGDWRAQSWPPCARCLRTRPLRRWGDRAGPSLARAAAGTVRPV